MDTDGSVTQWIGGLKAGDAGAAQLIWERYFAQLTRLARDRLRATGGAAPDRDEEDVALSALNSVCLGAAAGRFPRLEDRDNLWGLLVVVASRKAVNQARLKNRLKRGGGKVAPETDLAGADERRMLAEAVGREPSPELVATVTDLLRQRLEALSDDSLRQITLLRLEGHENQEIAQILGCATRTVTRKLDLIRRYWSREDDDVSV